jgi:membrane protease YdiL (CAAX protease family)
MPRVGPGRAIVASWLISSLLFGLLHVFNPNATWLTTLYLMLTGVFFGLGFVLTGRLGLPIGLHFAWNFVQGNVFGFPVSGNTFGGASVLNIEQGGPPLWTGGAFGPEAGLLGIGAIVLGCLLTLLWVGARYKRVAFYLPLAFYRSPDPASPVTLPKT